MAASAETPPAPQAASIGPIIMLASFICMLLIAGIALAWPYLVEEHRRLEPWKIAGVWVGDAMAVAWSARFVHRHLIRRIPLVSRPNIGRESHWSTLAIAAALGLCLDLGFTLYLIHSDQIAYRDAPHTDARAYDVHQRVAKIRTIYTIHARFQDAKGRPHDCLFRAYDDRNGSAPTLPPSLTQPLRNGAKTFLLPIRYDRRWPARCWIDGAGSFDDNDLAAFSLMTSILQAMLLAIFFLLVWLHYRRQRVPWWAPMYQVIPIATEAAILPALGFIARAS